MHGGQTLIIKPIDHPIDSTTDGLRRAEMGGADLAPPLGKRTSGLPTSALSRTEICFERQLIIRYLATLRSLRDNHPGFDRTSFTAVGLRSAGRFGSGGRAGAVFD